MQFKIIKAGQESQATHKAGFVYIVKPAHANVYKIGETDNLERRISQLEKKFDFKLECVFTHSVNDSYQMEQYLHMMCSRYHVGGDWFALTDEMLQDVMQYLRRVK